ncbi:MAG: 3'-5' exoribonuclease [Candidatus Pacebacteria bacterium]|nr:3'-5' exoribonuclease [Candidatus Paceibacterota bacterium]
MIVVDVETTGLNERLHSIVSIGAVDFEKPQRQFYGECRMFEGAQSEEAALRVNGFTIDQITDSSKKSLEQLMGEFVAWTRDSKNRTLMGFNTFFDHRFLQSSAERCHMSWDFGHRIIDIHSIAWAHMLMRGIEPPVKYNRSSINSDSLLEYVGLPSEPRPHNGLVGAKMEAETFSRLLFGRSLLSEYEVYALPAHVLLSTPLSDQQALF